MFRLKPTRMTVTDLRPTLSYRVGLDGPSRNALHWVELALATDPTLFAPEASPHRTPDRFVTFVDRFMLRGDDAILHIPPAALLTLARGERLYAGAALYNQRTGGTALAVIRPDAQSVYVSIDGFTGAGVRQRFGFSQRPDIAGDVKPNASGAALTWAGDHPAPGISQPVAPTLSSIPSQKSRHSLQGVGISREGHVPMNQSQGFMHKNAPYQHPVPAEAAPGYNNGNIQTATIDYDDGFGAPPAPIAQTRQNGQAAMPVQGNGHMPQPAMRPPNGADPHPMPAPGRGNGQTQLMPQTQPIPQVSTHQQAPADQQAWSQPLEFVLPEFKSYWPMDVIRTLSKAWSRYKSFTAGVSDTTQFPFSSIVCIRGLLRRKSDNSEMVSIGTGFYIGPNLLLTNAHNFAGDSQFHPVHSATLFTGLNSTRGKGNPPSITDAVSSETIDPSTAVTTHPLYYSSDPAVSKAHDLALVRVQNPVPHGQYFRIADFSPVADSRIVVCGYGASSHAQHDGDFDWQDLLPEAKSDYKQHMDADVIRAIVNNGEGIHYNLQTLGGNSGSPVFLSPQSVQGEDPTALMQVIGVHSSSATRTRNHGILLTPEKRAWALSGGTNATQQSYVPQHGQYGQQQAHPTQDQSHNSTQQSAPYGQPMIAPPSWAPIVTGLIGTATSAGIAGLQSSSGDLTWSLQKMDGWLPAGEHPTPTITVDRSSLQEVREVEINSPVYQGTIQGNMYAHFYLNFKFDGTGIGGISIEPAPFDSHDNLTGGMRIDMQVQPLLETFPSHTQTGVQVACVEIKMMYTYEWTVEDNDTVTVIYRFYGDGTYDSHVRGGSGKLDSTSTTYTGHRR